MNRITFYIVDIYFKQPYNSIKSTFKSLRNIKGFAKSFKDFFNKPNNLDSLMTLFFLILIIIGLASSKRGKPPPFGLFLVFLFLFLFFHTWSNWMSGGIQYRYKQYQDKILSKMEQRREKL